MTTLTRVTAYGAGPYVLMTLVYMAGARSVGSPLMDSLTEEQQKIRQRSSKQRMRLAIVALIVSIVFMVLLRPF